MQARIRYWKTQSLPMLKHGELPHQEKSWCSYKSGSFHMRSFRAKLYRNLFGEIKYSRWGEYLSRRFSRRPFQEVISPEKTWKHIVLIWTLTKENRRQAYRFDAVEFSPFFIHSTTSRSFNKSPTIKWNNQIIQGA